MLTDTPFPGGLAPPTPSVTGPTGCPGRFYGTMEPVTTWQYARLEYRSTGTFGQDKFMDWDATFYYYGGSQRWGTDERFDDLRHLARAGADGWQAYDRAAVMIGQPQRLHAVTYSLRRPAP
jgi:hypothetical protein